MLDQCQKILPKEPPHNAVHRFGTVPERGKRSRLSSNFPLLELDKHHLIFELVSSLRQTHVSVLEERLESRQAREPDNQNLRSIRIIVLGHT